MSSSVSGSDRLELCGRQGDDFTLERLEGSPALALAAQRRSVRSRTPYARDVSSRRPWRWISRNHGHAWDP
jgi:hypothetical protein